MQIKGRGAQLGRACSVGTRRGPAMLPLRVAPARSPPPSARPGLVDASERRRNGVTQAVVARAGHHEGLEARRGGWEGTTAGRQTRAALALEPERSYVAPGVSAPEASHLLTPHPHTPFCYNRQVAHTGEVPFKVGCAVHGGWGTGRGRQVSRARQQRGVEMMGRVPAQEG